MNKNLIALIATTALTANASVELTGDYEGTFTDGNPGAATYTQDLDLKMVGRSGETQVTVLMENLTGGSVVTANQVFLETPLEGFEFKGGNYESQNGSGLLQTTSAVANQMEVGFDVAGFDLSVGQESGVGKATVDTSVAIAGMNVAVQNVTASDRFVTAVANFFGLGTTLETQDTVVGRNTAVSVNANLALDVDTTVSVTGVYMDINDASTVTQDDGILGDISNANNGSDIKGGVVKLATTVGVVTGKMYTVNDVATYAAEVERGVMTVGYTKSEDTNGIFDAKLAVAF